MNATKTDSGRRNGIAALKDWLPAIVVLSGVLATFLDLKSDTQHLSAQFEEFRHIDFANMESQVAANTTLLGERTGVLATHSERVRNLELVVKNLQEKVHWAELNTMEIKAQLKVERGK